MIFSIIFMISIIYFGTKFLSSSLYLYIEDMNICEQGKSGKVSIHL